jgi:AGCS family alanine or glycine:cation symporter
MILPNFILGQSQQATEMGLDQKIDKAFKPFSDFVSNVVFFEVFNGAPFVIVLLVFSAMFFTLYFGFPNIKYFGKAIGVVRGKYDHVDKPSSANSDLAVDGDIKDTISDESKQGEVTHFQALATAVSGTVGNGNIAGVALAIALGGPGATFWMIICGLLGMSTKFVECTLGVQYRDIGEDGTVYGGPMYYLSKGLKEKGFKTLGKITAVLFAIFCIGGSFGGGNAAQSNQATIVIKDLLGLDSTSAGAVIGIILALLVGIIIIGGIKRIASVTEKIVPFMALLYLLACIYIIVLNFNLVDNAFSLIITQAFNPKAIGVGGVIGVLLVGFKRAAFSNEAGAGSASIAHSAVKTKYSASEGLVALLEPFIDTVVICTMTALVIIIFNFGGAFEYGGTNGSVLIDGVAYEGAGITSMAFAEYIPYSNVFLTIAVVLFAVSTMISWSYYGLQSWKYLFGRGRAADLTYKVLFLVFVIIGAAASMNSIWAFSDAMIFAMVFPNMVGLYFLFPVVKKQLARYLDAINNEGES